jgi:regulator of RNase E activity RraB
MADFDEQVRAHHARNRELVELIRREGGDLDVQRTIDLHFWAPDEPSADELSVALQDLGSSEVAVDPADPSSWSVETLFLGAITQIVAESMVERLVALAIEHGCVFDGWGTEL